MAYAMTKRGSQDNVITYEFICDTISDMNAIENKYRTLGTIAIVLSGESEGLEVYIAGSNKSWNSLSTVGAADPASAGGLSIYICSQNEVSSGLPNVSEPDESTIYLVGSGNTSGNLYEEYIYVDNAWEKFGGGSVNLSNYVQKTDIATQSAAGLVKVLDNGNVTFNEYNQLVLTLAGTAVVKSGQSDHPISVTHQHEAAFYGLAKAAGQDMKNSNNAVGTYTTEAATAIRDMIGAGTYNKPSDGIPASDIANGVIPDTSLFAPKANPVFTGSISMGRKSNTTVGSKSIALGYTVQATDECSFASGFQTKASGYSAVSLGYFSTASGSISCAINSYTIASGSNSFASGQDSEARGICSVAFNYYTYANGDWSTVMGSYNVKDTYAIPDWVAGTSYVVGDRIKQLSQYYQCINDNNDDNFTSSNWKTIDNIRKYALIIGNGISNTMRSNAYALDWDGNGHYTGDIYVNCNNDSTGGSKVATEAFVTARVPAPPVADGTYNLQVSVSNGTATYSWVAISSLSGVTF